MTSEIYLDWNSTTPPHPDVLRAMEAARELAWGNPASVHGAGRRARAALDDARASVAAVLGRDPRDVIFTSGGTEANNLALSAARVLVTSRLEHPSVTRVAEERERSGADVRWLAVPPEGRIDPADVQRPFRGRAGRGRRGGGRQPRDWRHSTRGGDRCGDSARGGAASRRCRAGRRAGCVRAVATWRLAQRCGPQGPGTQGDRRARRGAGMGAGAGAQRRQSGARASPGNAGRRGRDWFLRSRSRG